MTNMIKMLAFVFLSAMSAEAQVLGDAAREARQRQQRSEDVRLFTTEDVVRIDRKEAGSKSDAEATMKEPSTELAREDSAPASFQERGQWHPERSEAWVRLDQVREREAALQLRLLRIADEITAPTTSAAERRSAQVRRVQTQSQLDETRSEAERVRRELQLMESRSRRSGK